MPSRQPHEIAPRPAPMAPTIAELRVMPGAARTAWQATLAAALRPGDQVVALATGPLAKLWADLARQAGLTVTLLDTPDEIALARHLGADRFGAIRAVFLAMGDARTGAAPDTAEIRRALDSCFHDALLLVDASTAPDADHAAPEADIVIRDRQAGLARLAAQAAIAAE